MGDFDEIFAGIALKRGRTAANRWYWSQLLRSLPPFLNDTLFWRTAMLRNYIIIAFRNLLKHKSYTVINISGLAIGLACAIVVLIFVRTENTFDNYHVEKDRLYRLSLASEVISSGSSQERAVTSILWGPTLKKDYPEVEEYIRFVQLADQNNPWEFIYNNNSFTESSILYADPSVFKTFSWELTQGDPETALTEPSTMVLTESMAAKYFGSENPVGKVIAIDPKQRDQNGNMMTTTFDYTVVGVIQDIPKNSHFTFDFLMPTANLNNIFGGDINTGAELDTWFWRGSLGYTYLLLQEGTNPTDLEAKFPEFLANYPIDSETRARGYFYTPYLQSLENIYLDGNIGGQMATVGDQEQINMFSIVAIFILLIACINFMNYTTAHSSRRAHEVGMRKVVGAYRKQLVGQFLGESLFTSLISLVIAIGLAWFVLPIFYQYLNKTFFFNYEDAAFLLVSIIAVGLFTGLISGLYPAMFLSKFKPILILKNSFSAKSNNGILRKGLVVFQFSISVFLIIATLVVYNQLNFMRNYEMGFDDAQLLVLDSNISRSLEGSYDALKSQLLENPRIQAVTHSSTFPGFGGGGDLYVRSGDSADDGFGLLEAYVENNYTDVMGLDLIAGRNFSPDIALDRGIRDENGRIRETSVILNEEAVTRFGWSSPEEALGGQIIRDPNANDFTATVIGVIKNFNYQSLHNEIQPLGLVAIPNYNYIAIKVDPVDMANSINFIDEKTSAFLTDTPFEYSFLDESFAQQYAEEERTTEVFSYISFLAIFITSLGLFGLAAFVAQQKTKEIGIRKVLGASAAGILYDFIRSFALLILISFIIGMPLAYYVADDWLSDFPFRIDVSPGIFISAAVLTFVIAFFTIGYQTYKATHVNPVEALKAD